MKISLGIISVGFDRSPTPRDGLFAIAQVIFRDPRLSEPSVSGRVPRAQPQRLANVSLGFLGAAGKNLAKSDKGMRVGEIAIERQCMFALGDAFKSALRQDLDIAEERMAARLVRKRRQSLG